MTTTAEKTKQCRKCLLTLPHSSFSPARSKDGFGYWCHGCCNQYKRSHKRKRQPRAEARREQEQPGVPQTEWVCLGCFRRSWLPTGAEPGPCSYCGDPAHARTGRYTMPGPVPPDAPAIGDDEYVAGDHFTVEHALHLPHNVQLW